MANERFLNKNHQPSESDISTALGSSEELWIDIRKYIESNYEFSPELIFFTKNYGWSVRYRKSKKLYATCFRKTTRFHY